MIEKPEEELDPLTVIALETMKEFCAGADAGTDYYIVLFKVREKIRRAVAAYKDEVIHATNLLEQNYTDIPISAGVFRGVVEKIGVEEGVFRGL